MPRKERERMPVYTGGRWFGGFHVRVQRLLHHTYWQVSGQPDGARGGKRDEAACWVRHVAGLPANGLYHELVWLLLWHYRERRGGLDTRRNQTWEGVIYVAGD